MNKIILIAFLLIPLTAYALENITPPQNAKTNYMTNALPETGLYTIFSNTTSGTSQVYDLKAKLTCHTWAITTTKSGGVTPTITLQGSLDGTYYDTLDTTTVAGDWQRHIVNKGAQYIKANVLRNYTGARPEYTIKYKGGCN